MHDVAPMIQDLAIILGVASIVMLICQKLRQPLVLGYLLAGLIVGPYTTPFITVEDVPGVQVTAELGVVFLMFSLGLEFSFHKLRRVGAPASITGLLEVLIMLGIGYALGLVLGWTHIQSLFLGSALAISSTTIIVKALSELRLKQAPFSDLVCGVLIIEDLLAILLLVALSTLAAGAGSFGTAVLLKASMKLVLVVGSWFLVGYFVVPTIFKKWLKAASNEILVVVSVALCLILVNAAAEYHYSIALGAFIMGSILAETDESHRIENVIQPLRDIFAAVFFVSVGMMIDPNEIWANIGIVLIITGVTIVGKIIASFIGAKASRQSALMSLQVGFSMAQIGEFSFIIMSLGVALHFISQTVYSIIVAVSAITTFTTPYLIDFSYRGLSFLENRLQTQGKTSSIANHVEKKPSKHHEERRHFKQYFVRLFLNALVVIMILEIMHQFIWSLVGHLGKSPLQIRVINILVTYFFTAPFIFGMLFACQITTTHSKKIKWLFCLKVISFLVVLGIVYHFTHTYFANLEERIFVTLSVVIVTMFFKAPLAKIYIWFEEHLTGNIKSLELK